MENTKQIVFLVGENEYGMDLCYVNAIETYKNVVPVPNAANHILGIINLRGDVLPVYSLRTKFGMAEREADDNTKIIITKSNGCVIAFKVDEVKEIVDIQAEQLSEFPGMAKSEDTAYVDKVARIDNRLILLINQDGLLKEEESKEISKLVSKVSETM